MRYKYRIFAAGLLIAVILLGSLAGCGKSAETETEVDLADFKTGDVFCYKGLEWMSSKEEVEKSLSYTFQDKSRVKQSETRTLYYRSEPVHLFETEGVQQFQFKDKELQLVAFEFRNTEENGDLSKFFAKVLDELTKLYGDYQESVNKERVIGLMEGYKWLIENDDGSRNTMQLISYTKNEEVKIVLGMGYIPERNLLTDDPQI